MQIHDVTGRQFACSCMDFRINGLHTCKHVEAVLWQLQKRHRKIWQAAVEQGSTRAEIMRHPALPTLIVGGQKRRLSTKAKALFAKDGTLSPDFTLEDAYHILAPLNGQTTRVSNAVHYWMERRRDAEARITLRREYEQSVVSGTEPPQVTLMPLYPYQRDGMLLLVQGLLKEMNIGYALHTGQLPQKRRRAECHRILDAP